MIAATKNMHEVNDTEALMKSSRPEILAFQDEQLNRILERAWNEVGFYQDLWEEQGHSRQTPPVSFSKWPLWNVNDLRRAMQAHPPFGNLYTTAGLENILAIYSSSGTTGKPRFTAFTAADEQHVMGAYRRIAGMMGVSSTDRVCVTMTYGMTIGAWSWSRMAQSVGATLVPAGNGKVTPSDKLIDLIADTGVTALVGTPNYILYLARKAVNTGRPLDRTALRVICVGGESCTAAMKEEMQKLTGVERVTEVYANSDVSWVAAECGVSSEKYGADGMHILEDTVRVEILREDGTECDDGEYGELVLTSWLRPSTPRIRFRTGDRAAVDRSPCACGRRSARLLALAGRTDDAVRFHGITVWPLAVENLLKDITGRGREFYLERSRTPAGAEALAVVVETRDDDEKPLNGNDLAEALKRNIGVALDVRLVGPGMTAETTGVDTLPKIRRFIDIAG